MLFDSHQLGTTMPRGGHPPHQIQALDRTQPGLPIKPGRAGTMTHDYKRNGTTTLFAALNVLDGTVIGRCMQRHRHQEFLRFLNAIERAVPAGKVIHVILDNYAAHKHPTTHSSRPAGYLQSAGRPAGAAKPLGLDLDNGRLRGDWVDDTWKGPNLRIALRDLDLPDLPGLDLLSSGSGVNATP